MTEELKINQISPGADTPITSIGYGTPAMPHANIPAIPNMTPGKVKRLGLVNGSLGALNLSLLSQGK